MQPSTKRTLCQLVEDHVSSLVREAIGIQRHTKRAKLQHTINSSGASLARVERTLQAEDINLALQSRGDEKILTTNAGNLNKEVDRVDLNTYLVSEPKFTAPTEIGMIIHWLAVDGVQPSIPQNPVEIISRSRNDSQAHMIEEYEEHDTESGSSSFSVRQLLPRLLAEELRLYFNRVTLAIERGNPIQQDSVLISVAQDSGTQELVPFFTRYISRQIYHNIDVGNAELTCTLIRLAYALISNTHLHIELNLHQLLPSLISCVVARRLSSRPFENHWQLRIEASKTLAVATQKYTEQYSTLKARLIKILCEAMEPGKPLGSQYGGIVGISWSVQFSNYIV